MAQAETLRPMLESVPEATGIKPNSDVELSCNRDEVMFQPSLAAVIDEMSKALGALITRMEVCS